MISTEKKIHILLVEDDVNLGYLIQENLQVKGFKATLAKTGVEALQLIETERFDLAIIDVMLPEVDGFTIARKLHEKNDLIPFIFVTARSQEKDRIHGFELGADDYITKPFSFKELHYRILVILRRMNINTSSVKEKLIELGHLVFNPLQRHLTIKGQTRKLSQREAGLINILLQNTGEYVTRSEILLKVWGNDDYFTAKSMDVYITRLRKFLKEDAGFEIENLYGTGYRIKYTEALSF